MKRVNLIGNNGRVYPKEGENWSLNYQFWNPEAKLDKLFIMDGINGLAEVRAGNSVRENIINTLNQREYSVVTPYLEKGVKKSEKYPLKKIKKKYEFLYFKSTISFMLAYAALNGYDDIRFYDIFASGTLEWLFERPAVEYWIGVLVGQGAKITFMDEDTRLLGGRPSFGGDILYGYEMNERKIFEKNKYENFK